ncbi:hypothetical protein K227x_64690 [Rubripirellula lacrimiformis]|uniref:Uncharacterized protein n=1 Tax=Rubripirellula lacrimiformis TaxID=1930273 RepID=A0A517NLS8_9BACT|nr:hypothetical protein [Rubripirellula lacrimiformis]QDT08039.1 hypothetical protein K227x_64690 [Rubripirellula lacrimiformis]
MGIRDRKRVAMLVRVVMVWGAMVMVAAIGGTACANENQDAANLFDAIDAHQVEAKFIPADSTEARLIVANLTDQPVLLRLPSAFAAVPVLAQFGNQQGPGGGQGVGGQQAGGGQAGGGQTVGGGLAGQGNGQGIGQGNGQGNGQIGGFMRIPPARSMRIKITTVCLQHGKPEPSPRMDYQIVPLSDFTSDPVVTATCESLGRGQITQSVAQAVAWHTLDEIQWDQLAHKNRFESKYVGQIKYFSAEDLTEAKAFVSERQPDTTLTSSRSSSVANETESVSQYSKN